MALRTPSRNDDETSYGSPDRQPGNDPSDPRGNHTAVDQTPAGNPSDPRGESPTYKPDASGGVYDGNKTGNNPGEPNNNLANLVDRTDKKYSGDKIAKKESDGAAPAITDAEAREKGSFMKDHAKPEGGGFNPMTASNPAKLLASFKITKKKGIAGGIVGTIVAVGIYGASVVQGPLEFIHIAQKLQQFYTRGNEDFGNDRSFRTVYYMLSGEPERGRMGVTGNFFADLQEKRIADKLGLKPIYTDTIPSRAAGWQIVDKDKARRAGILNDILDSAPGSKIKRASDVTGTKVRGSKKAPLSPDAEILHYQPGMDAKAIRSASKVVVKGMGMNRIATAAGTRLSTNRNGAKLHWLNGREQKREAKVNAKAEDKRFQEESDKEFEANVKNGVPKGSYKNDESEKLSQDIDKATAGKSPAEANIIRQALIKGAGPAAVIGVMCSAKDIGDAAETAKFTNNVLPMIRFFWAFTSIGNQAMSGDQISLDELGALKKRTYDPETKTHILDAAPLQAEEGKKVTGPDVPLAAQPNKLGDKPDLFVALDAVINFAIVDLPTDKLDVSIGTGCGIITEISGWPFISHVSTFIENRMNDVLGVVANTSTDELMAGLISMINGESINIKDAVGGGAGALLGMGGKLAGIDQGLIAGAAAMTPGQAYELKEEQRIADIADRKNQPFFARYIDPYQSTSLVGSTVTKLPSSTTQFANQIANPFQMLASMFSNLSIFGTKVSAASNYDYGVRDYGYTVKDQDDIRFEDPYANGLIVEPNLEEREKLNEKYSKCFGMKVTADDQGVHLESKQVNILELEKKPEYKICRDDADKEMFKRFRFYIADAKSALSLACYEGDEASCVEVGMGGGTPPQNSNNSSPGTVVSGSDKELAQKLLDYKKDGKYSCDNPMDCEDLELMVKGESIKGGVGCVVDKLDKRVMQILIYLIEKDYKIGTYALCRSHSFNNGAHPQGKGLDISSINGKSLTSGSSKSDTLAVAKIIFDLDNELKARQIITGGVGATRTVDPAFVKFNRVAPGVNGQAAVAGFGSGTMAGHTDHIHVGY